MTDGYGLHLKLRTVLDKYFLSLRFEIQAIITPPPLTPWVLSCVLSNLNTSTGCMVVEGEVVDCVLNVSVKHITCVDCRHGSQEMSSSSARQECTLRWPMLIQLSADAVNMLGSGG